MANDPSSKKEAPPTPTTDCGCGAALELANYKFLAQVLRFTTNGSTDYEGLMKDMGVTNIKKDSIRIRILRCLTKLNLTREQAGLAARAPSSSKTVTNITKKETDERVVNEKKAATPRKKAAPRGKKRKIEEEEMEVKEEDENVKSEAGELMDELGLYNSD